MFSSYVSVSVFRYWQWVNIFQKFLPHFSSYKTQLTRRDRKSSNEMIQSAKRELIFELSFVFDGRTCDVARTDISLSPFCPLCWRSPRQVCSIRSGRVDTGNDTRRKVFGRRAVKWIEPVSTHIGSRSSQFATDNLSRDSVYRLIGTCSGY